MLAGYITRDSARNLSPSHNLHRVLTFTSNTPNCKDVQKHTTALEFHIKSHFKNGRKINTLPQFFAILLLPHYLIPHYLTTPATSLPLLPHYLTTPATSLPHYLTTPATSLPHYPCYLTTSLPLLPHYPCYFTTPATSLPLLPVRY